MSEWAGGNGASGGVAGGTAAGGGVKKVVPKDLINSVGALLDDPCEWTLLGPDHRIWIYTDGSSVFRH